MIISLDKLMHDPVLLVDDFGAEVYEIVDKDILLHDFGNFWTWLKHFNPSELTNEITVEICKGLVDEGGSLIKSNTIGSNNTLILKFNAEVLLFIDLKAHSNCTRFYENDLTKFIQFIDDEGVFFNETRFEASEYLIHKFPIWLIHPSVILPHRTGLDLNWVLKWTILDHSKEKAECFYEIFE